MPDDCNRCHKATSTAQKSRDDRETFTSTLDRPKTAPSLLAAAHGEAFEARPKVILSDILDFGLVGFWLVDGKHP